MKKISIILIVFCFSFNFGYGQEHNSAVKRNLTMNNNEILVEIKVNVSQLNDTSVKLIKIMETIPEGCSCTIIEEAGSIASIVNNHVKMFWFELPSRDFQVKYMLTCPDKYNLITGEFIYLDKDGMTKTLIIENSK